MPGSSSKGKERIVKWFEAIESKNLILDIGPGWGTYSKILKAKGQTWHAVEVHEKYIDRFGLNKLYDKIFIKNIKEFITKNNYDIVILGDVLEHIDNKSASIVIKRLIEKARYLIVSLPLDAETHASKGTGDVDWGNPHELHAGSWSNKMFIHEIYLQGGEVIALEKYSELAVYLIRGSKSKKTLDLHKEPGLLRSRKERRIYSGIEHFDGRKERILAKLSRLKSFILRRQI